MNDKQEARNIIIAILSGFPPEKRCEECWRHILEGYDAFTCIFGEQFNVYPNMVKDNIKWFCIGAGLI